MPLSVALVLALAAAAEAEPPPGRVELRVAPGVAWLGGTPYLHSFDESALLDAVPLRMLTAFSTDVATFSGWFGVAWLGLTYGVASPWNVTVKKKHAPDAEPRRLEIAQAHLFVLKGPAPRLRLRAGAFTLLGQATLGVRTGVIAQGRESFAPIELMLCAVASADWKVWRDWAIGLSVELNHSLATGWVTGAAGVQVRGWL